MNKNVLFVGFMILGVGNAAVSVPRKKTTPAPLPFSQAPVKASVHFEPNMGQVAGPTQWIARSGGVSMYLTGQEVVYALAPPMSREAPKEPVYTHNVHMRLVGSNQRIPVEGLEPLGSYSNYFIGRTEKEWFTGVPQYRRVRYKNVYPGIDVVYYAPGRNVEYDFVVNAGGDASRIELAFSEPVQLDHGDLIVAGLRQRRPKVLQDGREIAAEYRITNDGHVQLALARHDERRQLVIDPVLEFSTYLGGPGEDSGAAVAVDPNGFVYLAGGTQSPVPPSLNPFQQSNIVGLSPYVLKLGSDGKRVIFHTYLSSNGWDLAHAMAVDTNGNPIITGSTRSANFPLKNPLQAQFKAIWDNAFVAKLSSDGRSLIYSTYWGGSNTDAGSGIVVDVQGNAVFSGTTWSNDFPIKNAQQSTYRGGQDCFLTKVTPTGSLVFSTFFGGSGPDTCESSTIDAQGNIIIIGNSESFDFPIRNAYQSTPGPRTAWSTPFLAKFSPDGNVTFCTFFGGPVAGLGLGVTTDSAGNIYAVGNTRDPYLFVLTPGAFQSSASGPQSSYFVKFDPSGQKLLYASFFGGSGGDAISGIAVDASGSIYLAGIAAAPDFPVKNSFQPFYGGGIQNSDLFVAKFAGDAKTLIYSTLMGGHGNEQGMRIALDQNGAVYGIGTTSSSDFPTKNAYQPNPGGSFDIVFFKISDSTLIPASPLSLSTGRLAFQYAQGSNSVLVQTVTVSGGAFTTGVSDTWIAAASVNGGVQIAVNPAGLVPGTYNGSVQLIPASGTPATVSVTLTVLTQSATLAAVDPALVAVGSDDTVVTVHGSGFAKTSQLQIDGLPWTITPVSFVDGSTIKVSLPKNYFSIEYNHTIAVQNPQAALSNVLSLSVGVLSPAFTAGSVVNAGSFTTGAVAPGEIVTIFGTNLTGIVTFNDIPATMIYSSPTQVSATVPYQIGGSSTIVKVGSSAPVKLDVALSAPGIFAAVSNGDGTLTLYATGCGSLTQDALPVCQLPVSATINGESAQVLYAGIAPGLVQGANQINFAIPSDIASGPLTIVLTAGTASSKPFSYTLP